MSHSNPLRTTLVVDAANVVGSVPDGWWKDRLGATARLRDHLATLARDGLEERDAGLKTPRVRPEIVLVAEGRARGLESVTGVQVVDAPGEGDDEVVAVVGHLLAADPEGTVVVATADRGLQDRVRALGAGIMSARAVRHHAGSPVRRRGYPLKSGTTSGITRGDAPS